MHTCAMGKRRLRGGVLLLACGVAARVLAADAIVPESKADYGSGASSCNLYYAGGVPDLGLFVGQANPYHRNDRALVRFRISPYLLSGRPVASATLSFEVGSYTDGREDAYEIEITHLSYDSTTFSATDLVNSNSEVVGTLSVKSTEYKGHVYSVDVTAFVNHDIAVGNLYASFRFKNLTAEVNSTGKTGIMLGSEIECRPLPKLEIQR